ncbi:mechanosensitive ion channel family protein [Aliivibrio fischeri]|uniref:mechanosensitive ion channel family protein n=1 Tax=Aliivibrio fischeri TaxID=668 RepID=UPI0007C520C8|nr:mechanosensitive ion channel domain-containing protein [Aliivibrio fischeri]MCE7534993.1 mechanosensitive ion channel family protein [Aliivibrio fischeri]MCE7554784.1 mechanosensitive ion channel family protein [Aliivibrio fischeri]MCE7557888.1 mechanosensitive ion channel family protein [Aliivibrio fischeri]MCE7562052.1 mechanosensitive ion channel family protein [Aliivibrio fischeri]MCE7566227.1 mechanosensitive ion channel family protein [Aliivibrio fischeri]
MIRLFVLCLSLMVSSTALAEDAQSIDNLQQFASLIRWSGVAASFFIILGAWLFLRFIQSIVDGVSSQFAQRRMLMQKLQSFFQFFIYMSTAVAVFMLSFRVDDRVLALIGGTIAVSVGFALKDLTASFIAGLTVMIDRPFQVGDRVTFEGHYGDIIAIGLRSVRMQTLNDDIITIPNNKFLNEVTVSGNYGGLDMQVVIPFYIGMDQDINKARDIIQEAASSSRYIHLPKPVVVLVKQTITDNYLAIQLTCKAYVVDIKFEKLFETDITLRVMQEFRKANIIPPTIAIQSKLA